MFFLAHLVARDEDIVRTNGKDHVDTQKVEKGKEFKPEYHSSHNNTTTW
jgi:hypothetical protein